MSNKKLVLVVDDDPDLVDMVSLKLESLQLQDRQSLRRS